VPQADINALEELLSLHRADDPAAPPIPESWSGEPGAPMESAPSKIESSAARPSHESATPDSDPAANAGGERPVETLSQTTAQPTPKAAVALPRDVLQAVEKSPDVSICSPAPAGALCDDLSIAQRVELRELEDDRRAKQVLPSMVGLLMDLEVLPRPGGLQTQARLLRRVAVANKPYSPVGPGLPQSQTRPKTRNAEKRRKPRKQKLQPP